MYSSNQVVGAADLYGIARKTMGGSKKISNNLEREKNNPLHNIEQHTYFLLILSLISSTIIIETIFMIVNI